MKEWESRNKATAYKEKLALYKKVLKGVGASTLDFGKAWKKIAKENRVVARDAWDQID